MELEASQALLATLSFFFQAKDLVERTTEERKLCQSQPASTVAPSTCVLPQESCPLAPSTQTNWLNSTHNVPGILVYTINTPNHWVRV